MTADLIERLRVFADRLADLGERYSRRGWPQAASVETGRACDITDVLSALESSQSLLARRTEALEPFAKKAFRFDQANRLSNDGGKTFILMSDRECVSGIPIGWCRRASEALSDLGEAEPTYAVQAGYVDPDFRP